MRYRFLPYVVLVILTATFTANAEIIDPGGIYVGPEPDWMKNGGTPGLMTSEAAHAAGGELYPSTPGTRIPLPRNPDGSCQSNLTVGLIGPKSEYLGSRRGRITVAPVLNDDCALEVRKNEYHEEPALVAPPAAAEP